jgi:membrane-bound acyltransferase YfiQ involved in biofilm formation
MSRWLFSLGERHNCGLKKLLVLHFTFFFPWLFYFNLNKIAKKWEKFTNFLKPQTKNKKAWWVGVCL